MGLLVMELLQVRMELFQVPVLKQFMRAFGAFPVRRGEADLSALRQATETLKSGLALCIFPEGTRSRTGELLPFKKGGLVMAIQAQVPVVPVAVSGARAAMRRGGVLVYPVTVRIEFAAPVPTKGMGFEDRHHL